jgi:hypothetical protein
MAETTVATSAPPIGEGSTPESLDAAFTELEHKRRRAVAAWWGTVFALFACLPLLAAPFLFLAWIGSEPAPGTLSADLVPRARAWLDPYQDWVGPILFCWPIGGLFGMGWAFRRFAMRPRDTYIRNFKRQVFTAVCRQHFPEIRYEPGDGIHWRTFDESGLFPFESDVYRSEDRFRGHWGATEVCFAEARADRARRRWRGTDRGFEREYETYFRGIVFVADFHKHFRSTTRLLPRGENAASARGEERATLEDPHFESVFETWTTDQVDVRFILSTSMMSRLVALSTRFPGMRARFHQECVLLLLPSSRDRFEPSLHRRARSRAQIQAFVEDVRACLSVVDDLNLNTRIWSKS